MWDRLTNIWRKELFDSFRDRKAITQAILIPLLIGLFYAVFNPLIGAALSERSRSAITIPAQGIEYAGRPLLDALAEQKITLEPFDGDLAAAITRGEKGAGLIIPLGFQAAIAQEQPASLTLLANRTAGGLFGSGFSAERLDLAISAYNRQVTVQRIEAHQISPTLLTPITLETKDLATPAQGGGIFAAFTLPLLLSTIIAQGSTFIAIDVTAGEKERGTLEPLLVTPASDLEVLLGKLAAVFSVAVVPLVLTLLGFWVGSNVLPESARNGGILPLSVILGVILAGLPLSLFVNVVLMIVSVRTKAFKDAQSAITPVTFGIIIPSLVGAFLTPTNPLAYLIPVYGAAAAANSLAIGSQVAGQAVLLSSLGNLFAAAIAFTIALRLFNRERLLYGV